MKNTLIHIYLEVHEINNGSLAEGLSSYCSACPCFVDMSP